MRSAATDTSSWQNPAGTEARPTVQAMKRASGAGVPARVEQSPVGDETRLNGRAHQDPVYFSHVRPEILALVPDSARRVLDVGCGAGRLGEALKRGNMPRSWASN